MQQSAVKKKKKKNHLFAHQACSNFLKGYFLLSLQTFPSTLKHNTMQSAISNINIDTIGLFETF